MHGMHRVRKIAAILVLSVTWCLGFRTYQAAQDRRQALETSSGRALTAAMDLETAAGGLWHNRQAEARLDRVGYHIARVIPTLTCTCRFRILDSDRLNAASLHDGHVYITRGLYLRLTKDDLLAAALAHELGHVTTPEAHRRGRPQLDLHDEMAADAKGVRYLAAAGYDTRAMQSVIKIVEKEQPAGWARTRAAALARQN